MMRYCAAIFSSLLLAASFPLVIQGHHAPDLSHLAWVALVPLIMACRVSSLWQVGLLTFLTGLIYNALASYWIFISTYIYGRWSAPTSLFAILAHSVPWDLMLTVVLVFVFWLERRRVLPLVISLPIGWTLYEWISNYGPFGGNPWSTLGYSQTGHLSLIQSADLFGVYGLTYLIVLVNVVVVAVADWFLLRRAKGPIRSPIFPWKAVLVVLVLATTNILYGNWSLSHHDTWIERAERMHIGMVQPNVPQELKFRSEQQKKSMRILTRLTEKAAAQDAELVIWPEQAITNPLYGHLRRLRAFSEWKVPVLLGAVTSPLHPFLMRSLIGGTWPLQNSALQVEPGGRIAVIYHKTHLVPFGEYIPLKKVFRFFGIKKKIVSAYGGDFTPGEKDHLFEAGSRRYGVTICFEDLFPEISRAYAAKGADFLVNMTNDAWYDDSSAPWQHLTFSIFRAVENRRAMVRSTNTGVTAVIDPTGRIRAQLPLFEEGYLVESVPMGGPQTLYTRYQNAPWLILLGLVIVIALLRNIRESRLKRQS